ncbi:MAG: AMP-binding protein [Lachnospiraceae bacterium]|nr:AMP-binding protein [Lachnospiraceae bacterium]
MKVTVTYPDGGEKTLISIQGRVDTITGPQLAEELADIEFADKDVTFDFRDVDYISSAGLRQMMVFKKKNKGGRMRLENVSQEIFDVLKTTGLNTSFDITCNESGISTYVQKSFKQLLKEKAEGETAQAVFLKASGASYTWEEINQCAQIIAADLSKLGVKRGSHVGLCSSNTANWILTFFAIQKLGAIACLFNFGYKADEIVKVAGVGDVDVLCYGEISTMADEEAFLSALQGEGSSIRSLYNIRENVKFKERLSEYDQVAALFGEQVDSDDACVMIYTSGSTGVPKGVLISSYNILNASRSMSETIRITEKDRLCLILPLFHIFGMTAGLFCNMLHNGSVVIPENIRSTTILNTIRDEKCTLFHSVPTMLLALMNNKDFNPESIASLRASILAGAAVSKAQLYQMNEKFENVHFFCSYGLSEMAPISITMYDDPLELVATTVGKPVENIRIMISNPENGEECPAGTAGEILVEGFNLMLCYYKVDLDDQSIDDNGWLHTGDMGYLDENGYLHITGRIKELIIRGGENIMPSEVESAVSKHEAVENVKVVGVTDSFFGEVVCACVVMKPGREFNEDEMKAFLASHLAKYKLPAYYMVYKEFPKLASGKMDSVTIKKEAEAKFGAHEK